MQQLEPGTIMDGTISGIAPFGAFVVVGVGRDGLVHISELSPERVNSVEEVVKVGDKVRVKILEVDSNSKRISMTMRVDEPLPNDRERPAPRAAAPSFVSERAPGLPADRSFSPPPAFREGPALEAGRGGDRGARRSSGREGGRPEFERDDSRGAAARPRRDRGDRPARPAGRSEGGRGRRESEVYEPAQDVYTFEDPDEETFSGDATLEDLVSKFNAGKGRDRRQSRDDEDEDSRRADAIRRTLALRDEE
jgi:predicted RNA-binding protein with RPS1 domain